MGEASLDLALVATIRGSTTNLSKLATVFIKLTWSSQGSCAETWRASKGSQ